MSDSQGYDAARWRNFEHAGWQEAAHQYHDWLGNVTARAIEPLLDAVGTQSGVRLLDVATGPGYAAVRASQRGAEVVGIDFSAAMVDEASGRFPGLDFREGDAEALPFPDGSFDAVVCNFGILHFGQPERALAEAHRVLRSGGYLAFTVWDQSPELDPKQMLRRAVQAFGDAAILDSLPAGPAPDLFVDPDRCGHLLRGAGFRPPTLTKLPLVQPTPDPDAYFDIVLNGAGPRSGSPLRAQPPEALAAISAALTDALRACERDGITELPMPAILVSAQKP
jgi:SAM-dependent methyltransferase